MIASVFRYRAGAVIELDPRSHDDAVPLQKRREILTACNDEVLAECADDVTAFLWVHVIDPTPSEMEFVGDLYGLSRLQVADALNVNQRPKIEDHDSAAFVLLKELRYVPESADVETGQISVWIGRGYVVTVRHGTATPHSVRRRLREQPELLKYGPISVLYVVADVLVDGYWDITEEIAGEIEGVEEIVFSDSRDYQSAHIYHLKRENLEVKRAVAPLAAAAQTLHRDGYPGIPAELVQYFRDVVDHVLRTNDLVESHDQLLVTMLMAANAQQDVRQNQDMRKISAWAAIIAVPTAIAGMYGMNFDQMPELHWQFGYPLIVGVMLGSCVLLYWLFKRSGWL